MVTFPLSQNRLVKGIEIGRRDWISSNFHSMTQSGDVRWHLEREMRSRMPSQLIFKPKQALEEDMLQSEQFLHYNSRMWCFVCDLANAIAPTNGAMAWTCFAFRKKCFCLCRHHSASNLPLPAYVFSSGVATFDWWRLCRWTRLPICLKRLAFSVRSTKIMVPWHLHVRLTFPFVLLVLCLDICWLLCRLSMIVAELFIHTACLEFHTCMYMIPLGLKEKPMFMQSSDAHIHRLVAYAVKFNI